MFAKDNSSAGNSLDDLRGDGLAGTAPGGEEVDDHQSAGLSTSRVEVGLAVRSVSRGPCIVRGSLFFSQAWSRRRAAHTCVQLQYANTRNPRQDQSRTVERSRYSRLEVVDTGGSH
jgi:hypothetical protein